MPSLRRCRRRRSSNKTASGKPGAVHCDREALVAALAAEGSVARFAVVTPHSLALPPVIAGTDMVAIVPDLLSDLFRAAGLLVVPLPYRRSTTVVRLIWHHRMSADPGHAWFRTLLAQMAAEP